MLRGLDAVRRLFVNFQRQLTQFFILSNPTYVLA